MEYTPGILKHYKIILQREDNDAIFCYEAYGSSRASVIRMAAHIFPESKVLRAFPDEEVPVHCFISSPNDL